MKRMKTSHFLSTNGRQFGDVKAKGQTRSQSWLMHFSSSAINAEPAIQQTRKTKNALSVNRTQDLQIFSLTLSQLS